MIKDKNGNSCTKEFLEKNYHGDVKKFEEDNKTNKNCENCLGCVECEDCKKCEDCEW